MPVFFHPCSIQRACIKCMPLEVISTWPMIDAYNILLPQAFLLFFLTEF